MVTVDASIEHLVRGGLLKVQRAIGSYNGNEYEIFTPEEVQIIDSTFTSISSNTSPIQKVVMLVQLKLLKIKKLTMMLTLL